MVQLTDAEGVAALLELLPIPYVTPAEAAAQAAAAAAAQAAATAAAAAAAAAANPLPPTRSTSRPFSMKKNEAAAEVALTSAPSLIVIDYSRKPNSASLQAALLKVLAAVLEAGEARHRLGLDQKPEPDAPYLSMIANTSSSSSSQAGAALVPMVLNLLCLETPQIEEAPAAAAPGAGKGKADAKGKPAGKGKADALPAASGPFEEVLPPFPAVVQLAAMDCLKVSLMSQLSSKDVLTHCAALWATIQHAQCRCCCMQ